MEGYFPEGIWKTQTGFADSTGRADEADLQNLKSFWTDRMNPDVLLSMVDGVLLSPRIPIHWLTMTTGPSECDITDGRWLTSGSNQMTSNQAPILCFLCF